MSSQADGEIERIYMDYLQDSLRIFKAQQRIYVPYMLVALVLIFVGVASCYAGWTLVISPRTGAWLYWIGLILGVIVGVFGGLKARRYARAEAEQVARTKAGFDEFFKLYYRHRWWPKQMVSGEKYNRFLEIIGRPASA